MPYSKKTWAKIISFILNPDILISLILIIGVSYSPASMSNKFYASFAIIIFNYFILFYWRKLLEETGIRIDDTLKNKTVQKMRVIVLMPEFLIYIAETALVAQFGSIQPIMAIMLSLITIAVLSGLISIFWKISAHAEGFIFLVAVLSFYISPIYWSLIGILPVIWWARLSLDRHTPTQLAMGTLVPPIVTYIIFQYFGLI
ncbi:hypothetical protein CO101_03665 [Candidatus Berkelbacteria bacterium CG_4_9_14_3_um_filter_39_23]|uniref:Phosphatidic acid phosphatase type 2/haloperoxidase domain-containing protein n=2 Tax=Candidatus Berkelbacteria TaxID=1618330 RepID=A0A2M7CJ35_9BACT|nr:hypothetical protein [Candidatus Berkelbacteria bacterium]OIP05328.1 MAG: hypothetical protein AUK14_01810 [Candidatus Berkelbacteria bacterium CG2_30_39_44]PIR27905.1 MAG: hypothetical protein COV39_01990 [Candidatus Berkelbacteria bacterium CG11_big_fil_rev_8_21_14_0_20_40_23]PIV25652.1 MAG: hypothetical protein COS38_00515 [Candidatus Berkelbacteria bacterium CG03_land_8_20_14_0_80_40_36]PIX30693.1 MAG: hypothetical protein COZ62_01255 [Candidatus Berkelbacteria bacterium CG_4_8_14_3_um_f